MEVKKYIKIIPDCIPLKTLSSFIKYLNTVEFKPTGVVNTSDEGSEIIEKKVRNTEAFWLTAFNTNKLSQVHWANLFASVVYKSVKKYTKELNLKFIETLKIESLGVLKYQETGHYTFHVDSGLYTPRSISCIYILNNDYEGGELVFADPDGNNSFTIENKPNSLIMWPSNFLYPHKVTPVTKGIRYSLVAWLR